MRLSMFFRILCVLCLIFAGAACSKKKEKKTTAKAPTTLSGEAGASGGGDVGDDGTGEQAVDPGEDSTETLETTSTLVTTEVSDTTSTVTDSTTSTVTDSTTTTITDTSITTPSMTAAVCFATFADGVFLPSATGETTGTCLNGMSSIKDAATCAKAILPATSTATPTFAATSSTCYKGFAPIKTQADCNSANGYYLGQPAAGGAAVELTAPQTTAAAGVMCYASLNVLPNAVCSAMSFAWEASLGRCFRSVTEVTAQKDCLYNNAIWASAGGVGACYPTLADIKTAAACTSALPTAGAWVGNCVKSSPYKDSSSCIANTHWWIASLSPAVCIPTDQMTTALCTSANLCSKSSTGTFTPITCPTGQKWDVAKNMCAFSCPQGNCVMDFSFVGIKLLDPTTGGAFTSWGPAQWTFMTDLDGDSFQDIVTVNPAANAMYVMFHPGSAIAATAGFFSSAITMKKFPLTDGWGNTDIVSTVPMIRGRKGASLVSYLQDAANPMMIIYTLATDSKTAGMTSMKWPLQNTFGAIGQQWVSIGNFDGTGPGFTAFNYSTGKLNMALNNLSTSSSTAFTARTQWNLMASGYVAGQATQDWNSIYSADFNGDGKSELISLLTGGKIAVYSNKGAAGPSLTQTMCTGVQAVWDHNWVWVGDFAGHNNGVLDVVGLENWNLNFGFFNKSTGCFQNKRIPVKVQAMGNNHFSFAGDFDGDLKADIIDFEAENFRLRRFAVVSSVQSGTLGTGSTTVVSSVTERDNIFRPNPAGFSANTNTGVYMRGNIHRDPTLKRGYLFSADFFRNGLMDVITVNSGNTDGVVTANPTSVVRILKTKISP